MNNITKFAVSSFLSFFYFANIIFAQDLASKEQSKVLGTLDPVDLSGSFFTMFKGLAICIALLMLVVWILKKIKSPIVTGQGRRLKIIERLPVSAKSSLLLVEVNQKQILVGVGSDPISLVSEFIQADSIEDLQGKYESVSISNTKDEENGD